jgi:hypothetical protein
MRFWRLEYSSITKEVLKASRTKKSNKTSAAFDFGCASLQEPAVAAAWWLGAAASDSIDDV